MRAMLCWMRQLRGSVRTTSAASRDAQSSLIERVVLTRGARWAEIDAKLVGDLGTILEWAGTGRRGRKERGRHPRVGNVGLELVAGGGFEPPTFGL